MNEDTGRPRQGDSHQDAAQDAAQWWRTSISDIEPNAIRLRGYAIQELMGSIGFIDMLWLLVRGDLPSLQESALLQAAMLAAVDHGPQAPSIAVSRMAATCGVGMNGIIAQGVGVLGDVHGGAIEQCMQMYRTLSESGLDVDDSSAMDAALRGQLAGHDGYVPGFGHRFHTRDPRTPRLLSLADEARKAGTINGQYLRIAVAVEACLERLKKKHIPMNIDGAAAAVYLELGFEPPMGRALLVLSRSLGIVAHGWEQMQRKERIKGPLPRTLKYLYDGPPPRQLADTQVDHGKTR
jgi:citrate synthase